MQLPGKVLATVLGSYYLVEMEKSEFDKYYEISLPLVFGEVNYLTEMELLMSEHESAQQKKLEERMRGRYELNLGLFNSAGEFVGWHKGDQKSAEEYYMRISGILPAYQRRGLYTAMLECVTKICHESGFQLLSSKHVMTNNKIIIPKLKAGFIIIGTELSDKFGNLVRLEYYTNPQRRQIMHYRAGLVRYNPDWDKLRIRSEPA